MISKNIFHEICRRNGLVQCGPMNEYKLPAWKNKFGGSIVATWFKSEMVTVHELNLHKRNGVEQWVMDPCYRIEDPDECEARIKNTLETAKKLYQEFKLKSISKDFD